MENVNSYSDFIEKAVSAEKSLLLLYKKGNEQSNCAYQSLENAGKQLILDITESKTEQRTSSGIIIPDTAKEKPKTAPIVAMSTIENAEIKEPCYHAMF